MNDINKNLFIRRDLIARKYELFFHPEDNVIECFINKKHLEFLGTLPRFIEHTEQIGQEFQFKKRWNLESDKYVGYGNCGKIVKKQGNLISLIFPVTRGSGRAITRSLVDMFGIWNCLGEIRQPNKQENEQEMFLSTTCSSENKNYGSVMSADLSMKFSKWLYHQDDELRNLVNQKINQAMNGLFKKLFQMKPDDRWYCGLSDHGFTLSPPAGIYTCQFGILRDDQNDTDMLQLRGYKTFCHNLDYWNQQLVLMAGFLKICEAFRNSQSPDP